MTSPVTCSPCRGWHLLMFLVYNRWPVEEWILALALRMHRYNRQVNCQEVKQPLLKCHGLLPLLLSSTHANSPMSRFGLGTLRFTSCQKTGGCCLLIMRISLIYFFHLKRQSPSSHNSDLRVRLTVLLSVAAVALCELGPRYLRLAFQRFSTAMKLGN